MLKKLYKKSELGFAIFWIVAYCVLMSVGDAVSAAIGPERSVSLLLGITMSAVIFIFLKKNKLTEKYGLCKPKTSAAGMLYYIPVLIMLTANLWYGVTPNLSVTETVIYILTMFCVGFLEEIIFRGLLFCAMAKDNKRTAVIVSSITFGIGHVINLFNGSGAELLPNLLQIIYATAAGFMFVMMYLKTKSLIGCIVTHGIFNALSVFADEASAGVEIRIISCILLTVITGSYALYMALTIKKDVDVK